MNRIVAQKHSGWKQHKVFQKAWQQTLRYIKSEKLPLVDTLTRRSIADTARQMMGGSNPLHLQQMSWYVSLCLGIVGQLLISFFALCVGAAWVFPKEPSFLRNIQYWANYFWHSKIVMVGLLFLALYGYLFPTIKAHTNILKK